MTDLRIGGLSPLSTCDWPGELVATVFCQGCPWRCPYCHNPHLLPVDGTAALSWTDVLDLLKRRRGLLDGVVFSGGEPTLQQSLPQAIAQVRDMGFRVGLHSAGPFPERLAAVLPMLDWVGLDIKARFADYPRITGIAGSGEMARASLGHLLESNVAYEVRTTVHPSLISSEVQLLLTKELSSLGVKNYVVQKFREMGSCPDRLASLLAPPGFGLPQK